MLTPEQLAARLKEDNEKYKNVSPILRVLIRKICDDGFSYSWETDYSGNVHIRISKHRPKLTDSAILKSDNGTITCYCSRRLRNTSVFTLADPEVFEKVLQWLNTPTRPAVRQEPPKKKPKKMPPPRSWYFPSNGLL